MAEAEQQIDVGGPRADAVQRGQRMMRGIGVLFRQHVEVQPFGGEFARDVFQRLDLGGRKTEPAEPVGAGLADGIMDRTDRTRPSAAPRSPPALAVDSCWPQTIAAEAGKTRLALPQRRHARAARESASAAGPA